MISSSSLRVVIFGDDDFAQTDTAPHRLVSLVARGLESQGISVSLSCDVPDKRRSVYGRALRSLRRVVSLPRCDAVLYYGQSAPTLLALSARCWRRCSLIPYLVEWPVAVPGRPLVSQMNARLFCRLVFLQSRGVVVISQFLENIAKRRCPTLPVIRIPILCDPADVSPSANGELASDRLRPQVTYCADLDGYREDALLVVDAVAGVSSEVDLVLIGRASAETLMSIEQRALRAGLRRPPKVISGLSRDELSLEYARSSALLLPLDERERSQARYPSKLADYLVSGRPVVSGASGEPGALLSDGETAYLVVGGKPSDYAAGINRALGDPCSSRVGENGRALAVARLDYRQHGHHLAQFLEAVVCGSQRKVRS